MSAESKLAAVNDLRRMSQQFRGILGIADELAGIASLEQAGNEAQARLDAIKAECDAERQKLADEQKVASDELAQRQTVVAGAEEEAARKTKIILDDANVAAGNLVEAARAQAAQIVDEATRAVQDNLAAVELAKAHLAEIETATGTARETLAGVNAEITDAAAKRDEITAHIAALKAKF